MRLPVIQLISEFFTSHPLLSTLGVVWGAFSRHIWKALDAAEDRRDFYRFIELDIWSRYRRLVERFLDYTASRWFNDQGKLETSRLKDSRSHGPISKLFGVNVFTSESYDFHLKLALLYPIFSLFLFWVLTGQGGTIGSIELFSNNVPITERILIFIGSIFLLSMVRLLFMRGGWRSYSYLILAVAIAVAFANSGVVAIIITGAVAGAVSFSISFFRTASFAGAIAVAGAFTVAIAFSMANAFDGNKPIAIVLAGLFALVTAFAFAKTFIFSVNRLKLRSHFFNQFFSISYLVLTAALLIFYSRYPTIEVSLFVFVVLLPVLNAPLDWLSTGITRSLLYAIADREHGGWQVFLWFCIDLLLALFFLIAITVILIVALSTINTIALATGGNVILDFNVLFERLKEPLSAENWWIYFMLLSTLIPTLIHLLVASCSVILWFPSIVKKWTADRWQDRKPKEALAKKKAAFAYLTIFSPFALFAPFLVLFGLYAALHIQGGGSYLGGKLLVLAESLVF